MLNGVATAVQCTMQPFAAVGMACNLVSPTMRFIDNCLQLLHCERRLRDELAILVCPRAMRHVHLDPVGSIVELLARRFPRLHRSVDYLYPLRHLNPWRVSFQRIAPGGRNSARGREDPRPGNVALVHCTLDADIAVTRAFR